MAKIGFTKLGLKKLDEIKTIEIGENTIEVKQYLPVNEKLGLIERVINLSQDENNFPNPIKIDVIGSIEMIAAYTNITFTEKQKEDIGKLYDLLEENGIIDKIMRAIPEVEYEFVSDGIDQTIKAVYGYRNSVLGILDAVKTDYSNLDLEATEIQQKLNDPKALSTVKEVLDKLG